jgi:hypothetical protein
MDTPRDPHYTQPQRLDSCPYLGSLENPDVHFGYPTTGNYCFRVHPSEPVRIKYQDSICLMADYRQCPVFLNRWDGPLPKNIRQPDLPQKSSLYWISMALLIILAVCALILVLWFGSQMLAGRRFLQGSLNDPIHYLVINSAQLAVQWLCS